ncbi:PhnD/SsuA/transferrin family substrate-binding protein [Desulfococcus sp.]|uniref:PhnD/SsuA/transferrin family substrate-binding protein n=1 Tax=Desulfococcus sp. TaxID=2025834 RepID=UPI0035940B94
MKTLLILLSCLGILGSAEVQRAESGHDAVFRIGISSRTFEKINRNDAIAALKAWAATVVRERDLPEQPEVTWFDPVEDLRTAFLQDRLDAVSVTVEEAMLLGVQPEAVFLPATEQGFHVRYAVLVHRNGGITDLKGLMGKTVVMHDGQRMVLARPWLENVMAGRRFGGLTPVENPSKAILQVYFRQSRAALVTMDAFALACELNPQLQDDLKVLTVSPPFITSFFFFRPTFQGRSRERLEAAITELHTTPGGRQVLTVFQSSRMEKHPASILDATRQFLTAHGNPAKGVPSREAAP